MSNSLNLGLPYLEEAQAQKHVTVNEAVRMLDAIVQLTVAARTLATPPALPAEGDRYIVAAGATGAWAGHDTEVAAYVDGAWMFFAPREGWLAFDQAAGGVVVFDGTSWADLGTALTVQATDMLGINATADVTNRLSVRSDSVLFSPQTGGGATGDVRVVVNKDAAGDVASHLFQTGYSGRAEFGLIGNDAFSLKVSADGASFTQAFSVDPATAKVTFDDEVTVSGVGTASLGAGGIVWSSGLSLSLGAGSDVGSIALGVSTLASVSSGVDNVAVGADALGTVSTGSSNVAVGVEAGTAVTGADGNTLVGAQAGQSVTGGNNSALGVGTFSGAPATIANCAAVGASATVSGSNQVQLGNSATTTFAYGAVQDRSDARDKTDVRDTVLGLEFVRSLRPVDFRWDYREDYASDGAAAGSVLRDGSKARRRFHHGFLAQEIAAVIEGTGIDFGGYQDHALAGGRDVKSLGYAEFIAPMVRAIQELDAEVEALRKALMAQ